MPPVLVPRHSEFAPGHSLLPYQQIPEPNMPHNVSFNQAGYPGPHSPYQGGQQGPHSPPLPSPPPPLHMRHDLPPGSPHYSLGGLASSPQGPHSPHSLGPGTPPPAYTPRSLQLLKTMGVNDVLELLVTSSG